MDTSVLDARGIVAWEKSTDGIRDGFWVPTTDFVFFFCTIHVTLTLGQEKNKICFQFIILQNNWKILIVDLFAQIKSFVTWVKFQVGEFGFSSLKLAVVKY